MLRSQKAKIVTITTGSSMIRSYSIMLILFDNSKNIKNHVR